VVGIGGSAGSLHAFSELLAHLPSDTGMAFVIVSHLDPGHPSLLTHLLAGKSSMPVTEAADNVRVAANHVYVQPPGADLTMAAGSLRLVSRSGKNQPHLPIDAFLQSLAAEQGQRSAAVILSGAASDGALGLTAVKAAGGLTFAQDPLSAEYPSMPTKAIATGVVDFVMPPAAIAAELASMAGHAYLAGSRRISAATAGEPVEGEALGQIFALLRKALGVDFSAYKLPTIRRRVARRMLLHRIDDLSDYVRHLQGHPAELAALYHDILIMVTEFFRDPETFQILREQILPDMVRGKAEGATVRLWVPGCASGEEAYSLAITVLDVLAQQGIERSLKVFATDISERDLEKARRGLYPESITGVVDAETLHRYFVHRDAGYQISKTVRDQCVFARHDLTRDPPFPRIDLVSCRNVLIYMRPPLQRRVVSRLHYALLPGAYLLLGRSESPGHLGDFFDVADKKHKLFSKKAGPSPGVSGFGFEPALSPELSEGPSGLLSEHAATQEEGDRVLLADFVPPGVTVNGRLEVVRYRGNTAAYLSNPPGRPTRSLLDMVSPVLRGDIRSAVEEAMFSRGRVARRGLRLGDGSNARAVDVHVVPFESKAGGVNCIVLFQDVPLSPLGDGLEPRDEVARSEPGETERLRRELAATSQRLEGLLGEQEAASEELRAAHEEMLSSSEEMQSVNEELETSSEELRSTNEELESRNADLSQLSDDLNNLLVSVSLPIVMVGRDLRVRRYTPEAERLFRLSPGDLGRHVADLAARTGITKVEALISEAIDGLTTLERTVRDAAGRYYAAQVRPYTTADHRIDGAVLTLIDVDALTRSYKVEHRISQTLQRGFVHSLPVVDGLELAAYSVAANRPELVGGDFCDVFRLPEGPVVVLVGDVAGKGIAAASHAETVRSAVRTCALIDISPQFILSQVNKLLCADSAYGLLVTACVAVIDPSTGEGHLSSAGHPPPVYLGDGKCGLLEPAYGTPLGALDSPYEPLAFTLGTGDALVLYTDGVTEARRDGEQFGEGRLLTTLGETLNRHPQELVDELRTAVLAHSGELKDDMQLLAVCRTAGARP
jgi:two-component system, chemotaxis family, CheB/CheR fusion protein